MTERDINRVVGQLCDIDQRSAWDRVLEVGRVVFEGLVGGDEAEWHSRRGRKNVSLRKLVHHPRCPYKKTALSTAVGVYLFTRANPPLSRVPSLTPTHVTQVLGIEPGAALLLLQNAVERGWSVRELSHEVRVFRKESGERRGRPPSPVGRKLVTLARRVIDSLCQLSHRLGACAALDEESHEALTALLEETEGLLAEVRRGPALVGRPSLVLARSRARAGDDSSEPRAVAG